MITEHDLAKAYQESAAEYNRTLYQVECAVKRMRSGTVLVDEDEKTHEYYEELLAAYDYVKEAPEK